MKKLIILFILILATAVYAASPIIFGPNGPISLQPLSGILRATSGNVIEGGVTFTPPLSYDNGTGVVSLGAIDHGDLLGLSDDDHTQYHTDARALTWLGTRSTSDLSEGSRLYFTDERAQDAIGQMVDGTLIYTDGTPLLSRAAISGDGFIPVGANTLTLSTVNSNVGTFGSPSDVGVFTVNGKGLITSASNTAIFIPTSNITDFALDVNDRVASLIQDGSGITWVYDRMGDPLSATLTPTVNLSPFTTTDLAEGTNLYFTDERAQDAVGAMVDSSLVYTDGTPLLSRAALVGDVAAPQGSNTTTLATVNSNVGTFGSATQSAVIALNGKGLATSASNVTITPAVGSITGLGTGVATWLATPSSANLRSAVTDETGSGSLVFATGGTLNQAIANTLTVTNLTSGRVPFATTGGQLTDDADMTFATDTLTATNVVGSTEVRMGNGLVNNPSLAFDSDTDTGWYRVGANQLGISAAGVQSAQFEELHVSSGSAQGWRLRNVTATATIPTLVPNQSDTNTGIGWDGADELSLVAGGTQAAFFGSTFSWVRNTLGVNTSTPSEVLDVNGNAIVRGVLTVDVGAAASAIKVGANTGTYSALQFNGANNTARDFIYKTADVNRFTIRVSGNETGGDAGGNLAFISFDDAGGTIGTAMQIRRSNGNVGIGVTGASAKLQVNGQVGIVDGMSAPSTLSGYGQIYIDSADGDLKIKFGDGTVKTIVTD